jgi:hypothetical protein
MTSQHRTAQFALMAACAVTIALPLLATTSAAAEPACSRTVIFTTPGVTWSDVARVRPPALLSLARRGAMGSMSVHTDQSRPSYSSAFTTLGAGARMPGFEPDGTSIPSTSGAALTRNVDVASRAQLQEVSKRSGYGARAGALAGALNTPVVAVAGAVGASQSAPFAQWPLLSAIDPSGKVSYAAANLTIGQSQSHIRTDSASLMEAVRKAFSLHCATVVIDAGILERDAAESTSSQVAPAALARTDHLLARVSRLLDLRRDLLLVVSPTSPPDVTHLGIALAVGPGYKAGSVLESASTRRAGIVTLPDVAPTVLKHLRIAQPSVMSGQPFFTVSGERDRLATAVALDRDSVFIDGTKPAMATVFLVFEVAFFASALTALFLSLRHTDGRYQPPRFLVSAAMAVASLPIATYVVNLVPASRWGRPQFLGVFLLVVSLMVAASGFLRLSDLDRLGAVAALSLAVIALDLVSGGHLQLNSILGDSPLIAGRFAGAGNNSFAIMAATAVVTATLIVWHRGRRPAVLAGVALLFLTVVLVDGAPQVGSDVGGVLALVPGFGFAWILLAGRGISWKIVAVAVVAAVVASTAFIAIDVSRPPEQRTHLGRFFEDVRSRGGSAFIETVQRKGASNFKQLRSFQNLYKFLVPAIVTAIFLFWPLRWWKRFGSEQPSLRAGFLGALGVAFLGSALNDSGITIFTTMLLFLAPLAILTRFRFPEPSVEASA